MLGRASQHLHSILGPKATIKLIKHPRPCSRYLRCPARRVAIICSSQEFNFFLRNAASAHRCPKFFELSANYAFLGQFPRRSCTVRNSSSKWLLKVEPITDACTACPGQDQRTQQTIQGCNAVARILKVVKKPKGPKQMKQLPNPLSFPLLILEATMSQDSLGFIPVMLGSLQVMSNSLSK